MAEQDNTTPSERWLFRHSYPTPDDAGEVSHEEQMTGQWVGDDLVLQSEPGDGHREYRFVRLTVNGEIASGTWYENADPDGLFKGATYSGAGQLVVDEDKQHMVGKWAGAGINRQTGKMEVYTGGWELTKLA